MESHLKRQQNITKAIRKWTITDVLVSDSVMFTQHIGQMIQFIWQAKMVQLSWKRHTFFFKYDVRQHLPCQQQIFVRKFSAQLIRHEMVALGHIRSSFGRQRRFFPSAPWFSKVVVVDRQSQVGWKKPWGTNQWEWQSPFELSRWYYYF